MVRKFFPMFLNCFLFCFMLLIFGPAEIFFSNVTEFQFVYGDFAGFMTGGALIVAIILTIIGCILSDKLKRIYRSFIFAMSLGGYIQVMFMNKQLDLLGINPDGYHVKISAQAINLLIWFVVMGGCLFAALWKKEQWEKIIVGLSAFLLGIQVIAYISLLVTAEDEAYKYPESAWHLSGAEQFTVSANENVIVFILDMFSNSYMDSLETTYPGATDFLHDFTYYSNMDCTYMGTFPSLAHMLTGCELDYGESVNDWFVDIWESEKVNSFYNMLEEADYETNLYTSLLHVLTGMNSAQLLEGKFSNLTNEGQSHTVRYERLYRTMCKMSAYRMVPEVLKSLFYTNITEYSDIVQGVDDKIYHNNYEFYEKLCRDGLNTDQKHNRYIVQHLMGPHEFTTDEYGHYKENATLEETTKGCMVIVSEYLDQLKELGVYDSSTIIITADHGIRNKPQVIFYMKEAGEHHDKSPVSVAPVSHKEFLPTIAKATGGDCTKYGQSVFDIDPAYDRERTYWLYTLDPEYPMVPYYNGEQHCNSNVYYGYTYTGNADNLYEHIENGPDVIEPIVDSVY